MLIKFRGGNMGIAPRPVLVDLSSDIPESIKSSKLFKTAVEKQKLQDQIKKRELNLNDLNKSS
jgi:hypothetical protein